MLPRKCSQPACRNIDVKIVRTPNRAGTAPYTCMNFSSAGVDSDCSKRNAILLRTMNEIVKKGNVRDGMTSRSGIMRRIVTYNSGPYLL